MAGWTDEEIAFAADLWRKGYSASGIANAMRADLSIIRSRQSVVGIAHRRRDLFPNKPRGGSQGAQTGRQKGALARKPVKPPTVQPLSVMLTGPTPTSIPIECRNVTLMERGPGECCFPTNSGGPFTYCGLPAESGSYCEFHYQLMHGSGTESERSAHRVLEREAA